MVDWRNQSLKRANSEPLFDESSKTNPENSSKENTFDFNDRLISKGNS